MNETATVEGLEEVFLKKGLDTTFRDCVKYMAAGKTIEMELALSTHIFDLKTIFVLTYPKKENE